MTFYTKNYILLKKCFYFLFIFSSIPEPLRRTFYATRAIRSKFTFSFIFDVIYDPFWIVNKFILGAAMKSLQRSAKRPRLPSPTLTSLPESRLPVWFLPRLRSCVINSRQIMTQSRTLRGTELSIKFRYYLYFILLLDPKKGNVTGNRHVFAYCGVITVFGFSSLKHSSLPVSCQQSKK